jgi:hypothetical protein
LNRAHKDIEKMTQRAQRAEAAAAAYCALYAEAQCLGTAARCLARDLALKVGDLTLSGDAAAQRFDIADAAFAELAAAHAADLPLRVLGEFEKKRKELTPKRADVTRTSLVMGVQEWNIIKEITCLAGGLGMEKVSLVILLSFRLLCDQLSKHGALPHIETELLVKATPTPRFISSLLVKLQPIELLKLAGKFAQSGRVSITSDVAHKRHGAAAVLIHFYDVLNKRPDFVVVDSVQVEGETGEKNGMLLWRAFERFKNVLDALPLETRLALVGDASRTLELGGVAGDGTSLVASIVHGQAGVLKRLNGDKKIGRTQCSVHDANIVYAASYARVFESKFNNERMSPLATLKNWAWLQENIEYETLLRILKQAQDAGKLDVSDDLVRVSLYICTTRWGTVASHVAMILSDENDMNQWRTLHKVAECMVNYWPKTDATPRAVWTSAPEWDVALESVKTHGHVPLI